MLDEHIQEYPFMRGMRTAKKMDLEMFISFIETSLSICDCKGDIKSSLKQQLSICKKMLEETNNVN